MAAAPHSCMTLMRGRGVTRDAEAAADTETAVLAGGLPPPAAPELGNKGGSLSLERRISIADMCLGHWGVNMVGSDAA